MLKKNISYYLVLFLLFFSSNLFGQKIGVDSKGKSTFSFYSLSDYRLEFSTEEPLSIGRSIHRFRTTFTMNGDTTIIKNSGIYLNLSMLNSADFLVLSDLNKLKPGLGIKIGYQKSIEAFTDIAKTPKGTYVWGINAVFNMDNFKLFNTLDSLIIKKYPLTYGVEGNFTYFSKSKSRNIIAVNVSYNRTWNDDDLLNYQNKSGVYIGSNVVALEDFEGRFGELKTNIDKFRLSTSFPFYIGYLNPIPYVVLVSSTGNSPKYFTGTFINILTKPLEAKDYTIPSSIGVGIDWTYSGDKKWSSPNIFLRGAINFGKFK